MQVSLRQPFSPGFWGKNCLVWSLLCWRSFGINHRKSWWHFHASYKILLWGHFMVCAFPLECFKELDFFLFAEHSSSCVLFALQGHWKKLLFWKLLNIWDNCTEHFTVCRVLAHYFTQSFLTEAQDVLCMFFRKTSRGTEGITEA